MYVCAGHFNKPSLTHLLTYLLTYLLEQHVLVMIYFCNYQLIGDIKPGNNQCWDSVGDDGHHWITIGFLQQTRSNHPMLVWCCFTVCDADPTLHQHWSMSCVSWVYVSCLLGDLSHQPNHGTMLTTVSDAVPTLHPGTIPETVRHWPNYVLMLFHCLRCLDQY